MLTEAPQKCIIEKVCLIKLLKNSGNFYAIMIIYQLLDEANYICPFHPKSHMNIFGRSHSLFGKK